MTSSMTAFAHIEESDEYGAFTWEIRTVNQRYLEPHFHIPESTRVLEPILRDKVRKTLHRGKVECTLTLRTNKKVSALHINHLFLDQLQIALTYISKSCPSLHEPSSLDVLQWPGVIEKEEDDSADRYPAILMVFEQALSQIQSIRQREGQDLHAFIMQRITSIQDSISTLRKHIPGIIKSQQNKIKERCQQLIIGVDETRLEQELVLLTQKSDISEELDRLQTHTNEVKRVLNMPGAIGRRLDFLMQELNREANTIASKSINTYTSQASVDIKVMIEQAREQVQNIE